MSAPTQWFYSAAALIREFGTHIGSDRRCSCCGKFSLYMIRYLDDRGTVLLCSICDREGE